MVRMRSFLSICVIAVASALAFAEDAAASPSQHGDVPARAEESQRPIEPYPWSAGARAFLGPGVGIAGMGAGLDVAYSVLPYLAVGAQHLRFVADQGADPQYCVRCIRSGHSTFAFAEGRYWPEGWATPYVRLGAGLAHLRGQRVEYELGYTEDDLGLLAEAGIDWHYRFISLRTFAFHQAFLGSELDKDRFIAFGAQLGARF